jgi:hypothetical protein
MQTPPVAVEPAAVQPEPVERLPAEIGSLVETVVPLSVILEAETQAPDPPPLGRIPAARVAEVASTVVLVKQGIPPELTVPETVSGKAELPPLGVAHVPSPRQKVEEDALVPLFRFVTGRLPVIVEPAPRLTLWLVSLPLRAPPSERHPITEVVAALQAIVTVWLACEGAAMPRPKDSMIAPVRAVLEPY